MPSSRRARAMATVPNTIARPEAYRQARFVLLVHSPNAMVMTGIAAVAIEARSMLDPPVAAVSNARNRAKPTSKPANMLSAARQNNARSQGRVWAVGCHCGGLAKSVFTPLTALADESALGRTEPER